MVLAALGLMLTLVADHTGQTRADRLRCAVTGSGACLDLDRHAAFMQGMRSCATDADMTCVQAQLQAVDWPQFRGKVAFGLACEQGDLVGCSWWGMLRAAEDRMTPEVLDALTRACAGDQPLSCWALGDLYLQGTQLRADPRLAETYLTRACDGGLGKACVQLGPLVDAGDLGAPDPVRAVQLYQKGCDLGVSRACLLLAMAYDQGTGVAPDLQRSALAYQRLCDAGEHGACALLGAMILQERLGPPDPDRALGLFLQGCEQGDSNACALAGILQFETGEDREAALTLLDQSCEMDNGKACDLVQTLRQE